MRRFEYQVAADTAEAGRLGAAGSARMKAGGIDLLDRMKEGLDRPAVVVGLHRALPTTLALDDDGALVLGAGLTLAELGRSELVRAQLPMLATGAGEAATPAVREAATLGGNLLQRPRCWYFRSRHYSCLKKGGGVCWAQDGRHEGHALFDNDTCAVVHPSNAAPALIAADARARLTGPQGEREIPLDRLYSPASADPTVEFGLAPGEVLTELVVPSAMLGPRCAHYEVRHKQSFDWPLAMAAANLNRAPRLVLGAVASVPMQIPLPGVRGLSDAELPDFARKVSAQVASEATPLERNAWRLPLLRAAIERALMSAAGIPQEQW
jgi:xanthine dehydrogenase YagS FAD-binding subunit